VDLLTAAARAGHTVLPRDVIMRTCHESDIDLAVAEGSVVEVEWKESPAWALAEIAEIEELLADGLLALAGENRLAVVIGPETRGRAEALQRALGDGVAPVVLEDAHLVGLDAAMAAVEDLPEDAVLAISLDSALPLAAVTGAVALDLAASDICPVLRADTGRDSDVLSAARREVAAGRWPSPPTGSEDKSLVVLAAASPEEALVRVTQLISTSIPRAFGHSGAAIAVLALDGAGPVGAEAVREMLRGLDPAGGGPDVGLLGDLTDRRWPAVILLLPGVVTPALTRAAIYAGLRAGVDHVSIVHGYGPAAQALAEVVATTNDRPRRTRLAELLRT